MIAGLHCSQDLQCCNRGGGKAEGKLQVLVSPRRKGLDSLFKEVTVFKVAEENQDIRSDARSQRARAAWGLKQSQFCGKPYKPLTRVSNWVPGVHGKRGLERGWQKRLGQNASCDFGGENVPRVPPPKPVLEASESGKFDWSVPVSSSFLRKWQGVSKRGGETYHRRVGVQNCFFWEGVLFRECGNTLYPPHGQNQNHGFSFRFQFPFFCRFPRKKWF